VKDFRKGGLKLKLQFFGATQSVTGSMHLIEANVYLLLLNCGIVQGKRQEARRLNSSFPFDVNTTDVVVLSHVYFDHSGKLPVLVMNGFDNSVFSTSATRDLYGAMLRDSSSLQDMDVKYVNKLNAENGLPFIKPLFIVLQLLTVFHTDASASNLRIRFVDIPEPPLTWRILLCL
jgi:metallo-beta-lactamase family protein